MTTDPRQELVNKLVEFRHPDPNAKDHNEAYRLADAIIALCGQQAPPLQGGAPMDIADVVQTLGMAIEHGIQDPKALAAYRNLGHFIICRTNAIAHRHSGNIDRALIEEKDADAFYKRLPEQWRW